MKLMKKSEGVLTSLLLKAPIKIILHISSENNASWKSYL